MEDRRQRAAEVAMRRRRGASRAQSEKVKANMLAQDDLYTTCRRCQQKISGTLADIHRHYDTCVRR